jgi:GT2 family glycosyltransferase
MLPCIVIPVHNRRETTLACLHVLQGQGVLEWATLVIVDDGSTDGTARAVRSAFPQAVVLEGDGNLWWGRGINLGMQWAFAQGAESVVWLNDDTYPRPGALEQLVQISGERQSIATAQCLLRETGELHYGGLRKTKTTTEFIPCPPGEIMNCDTICGNCVCIPRIAFERVGLIDVNVFPHFAGDADYGLRAKEVGVPLFIVGDALCDCSYGDAKNRRSWLLGDQSIADLWRGCFHPYNGILSRCGIIFRLRHWGLHGLGWLLKCFARLLVITVARAVIPRRVLLRLASHKNASHQRIEAVRRWEAGQTESMKSSSLP